MGKAMTVTDSKTLWGEDPDKRNAAVTVLTYFCLDNKNHTRGGGGALPYKPIWDMPFFRVSCFSINS